MNAFQKSIGRDAAIAMAESKWWVGKDSLYIAKIGMITKELCLPFDVFHAHLEKALGRPVSTYEFALNLGGIWKELLLQCDAPTMQEIIDLIPPGKRPIMKREDFYLVLFCALIGVCVYFFLRGLASTYFL